jgi:hypothetical protein
MGVCSWHLRSKHKRSTERIGGHLRDGEFHIPVDVGQGAAVAERDPKALADLDVGRADPVLGVVVDIGDVDAAAVGNLVPGAQTAIFSEKPFAGRFERGRVNSRVLHLRVSKGLLFSITSLIFIRLWIAFRAMLKLIPKIVQIMQLTIVCFPDHGLADPGDIPGN